MLKIVPRAEVLLEARRPLVRMLRGKIEVASRFAWSEDKTTQAMRQSEVRELLHRGYAVRAKTVMVARLKALVLHMPWVKTLPRVNHLDITELGRWGNDNVEIALAFQVEE